MKDYLFRKTVGIIAMIYMITAFFTPVYAYDTVSGDVPAPSAPSVSENVSSPGVSEPVPQTPSSDKTKEPEAGSRDEGKDKAPLIPAEESTSPEEAAGGTNGPFLHHAVIYLYKIDNPNVVYGMYEYTGLDRYRYNVRTDREVPLSEKTIATFKEVKGMVSSTSITFYKKADTGNVEFEVEQLDEETGEPLSSTGRVSENKFMFDRYGLYRVHVYALYDVDNADEEEAVYYFNPAGLDKIPPTAEVELTYNGNGYEDKYKKLRYASGKITVTASDEETGLEEKPFMFDYPDGEWTDENVWEHPTGKLCRVGVRDRTKNIAVINVDTSAFDEEAPEFKDTYIDDKQLFNGYALNEDIHIIAEDETQLAERFFSRDGTNWNDNNVISVTCNGTYDFYLRDVFNNSAKRTLEVCNIDHEAPEVSYSDTPDVNVNGYSYKHTLKIDASDPEAGLPEKAFTYDGGKSWAAESSREIRDNGTYALCVKDGLGNTAEVYTVSVNDIDNTAPEIVSLKENRDNRSGSFAPYTDVTVTAKDTQSGLTGRYVSFDDGETWVESTVKRFTANGTIRVKVKDGVGNTAGARITVHDIDSVSPQIEVTGNPTGLTKTKAVLKASVRDSGSGLKSVCVESAKAGVKKVLREYDPDANGAGRSSDTVEAEITSNGEYVFTVTDMCGNTDSCKVSVTKIIKPTTPSEPENPEDDKEEKDKKPSDKDKKGETDDPGKKTVVIGKDSSSGGGNGKESTITVKGSKTGTVSEEGNIRITASSNRSRSAEKEEEEKTEEEVSENEVSSDRILEDFSSEFYETELPEYYSENEPKELEAFPNPDETVVEEKSSGAWIIAGTVFAIVLGLSALTLYLLIKKGIIKKPEFLGGEDEDQ